MAANIKINDTVLYENSAAQVLMLDSHTQYAKLRRKFQRSNYLWAPVEKLIPVIPAALDEKQISSDWIEDSFFDVCVENTDLNMKHHEFVGYRNGAIYTCKTSCKENYVTIQSFTKNKMQARKEVEDYFQEMNYALLHEGFFCIPEFVRNRNNSIEYIISFYSTNQTQS